MVLVAQHTFVVSDPWTAKMVGSEVAEDSLLEATPRVGTAIGTAELGPWVVGQC